MANPGSLTAIDSWLADVANYLSAQGIGIFGNTPTASIFIENLPSSPVAIVGLIGQGGPHVSDGLQPIHTPTLQILVRDADKVTALRRARVIFSLLDGKWNFTTNHRGRLVADHLPGPGYLSEAGHYVMSLNFSGIFKEA